MCWMLCADGGLIHSHAPPKDRIMNKSLIFRKPKEKNTRLIYNNSNKAVIYTGYVVEI